MAQYELRSFKAPLLRGHTPIPLDPLVKQIMVPTPVGTYYDAKRGDVYEDIEQTVPGDVTPLDESAVIDEAQRLFSNPDCWHVTINEYAKDADGNELRGTPHWCASVEQVQTYLNEGKA